jgi:hypothetical protein
LDVHTAVLKLAESWQKTVVGWRQVEQPRTDVGSAVFNWLAVMVCLYWAEGRQLLPSGQLESLRDRTDASEQLGLLWWEFCCRFGQKSLFQRFQLSGCLPTFNQLTQESIDDLYGSDLEQTALTIEILGMLYEAHLSFFDPVSEADQSSQWTQKITDLGSLDPHHLKQHSNTKKTIKKSNGIYYTPQSVVQYVVQQTIDCHFRYSHTLSSTDYKIPQILDPTCGSGAFLLAAYQYLLDHYLEHQLLVWADAANPMLQRNRMGQLWLSFKARCYVLSTIHGIDLDPQAVLITQTSLWLKLIENFASFDDSNQAFPLISPDLSIHCGNALTVIGSQRTDSAESSSSDSGWHAFSNAAVGFDIVMGNPPYIDAEQMTVALPTWRAYCTAHYQTAKGNWDLFCVFIEKALQLCREGGFTSLVVPNKLLSADYASATRLLLSQTSRMIAIRDYSEVSVFAASVYPIVYTNQKISLQTKVTNSNTNQHIFYEQMQTLNQVGKTYEISLHHLTATPQPWLVSQRSAVKLLHRLEQFPKLGSMTQVLGAATVAEAYLLKNLIQENATPASTDFRLVNSGTIDRYWLHWGQKPLRYLRQSYWHPVVSAASLSNLSPKRLAQAQQSKIIVAGLSRRLECALDLTGSVLAGKSTAIVLSSLAALDLRYLLALLNSRLASFYTLNCFQGNRLQGGYVRIGAPQLRQIPIALPHSQTQPQNRYDQLIDLVEYRLRLQLEQASLPMVDYQPQLQAIDGEIDALVYAIYQLEDTEIEIIMNDPTLLTIHR